MSPRSGSTPVPLHAQMLAKLVCGQHGLGVAVRCWGCNGARGPCCKAVLLRWCGQGHGTLRCDTVQCVTLPCCGGAGSGVKVQSAVLPCCRVAWRSDAVVPHCREAHS